jgi:hypothetical protein
MKLETRLKYAFSKNSVYVWRAELCGSSPDSGTFGDKMDMCHVQDAQPRSAPLNLHQEGPHISWSFSSL